MASFDSKLLNIIASKAGIDSENALKKASEYLRLLQLRVTATSGVRQLSDTSRTVMCLDLASSALGLPLEKSVLIRLAGVNKKQYLNGLHLIEKLLELTKPVNVTTLSVQLGVSEMAPLALKILNRYVELHLEGPNNGRPLDISLPVYHCVAVHMACKSNKVKVDKSKLVDISRVKKVQFEKLIEDFSPILNSIGPTDNQKAPTKRSHKLISLVQQYDEENKESEHAKENAGDENKEEDFEAWKKRILSEDDD